MEQPIRFELNYSLKNIPLPSPKEYTTRLIEMTEKFLKRMRWKAYFFLKGSQEDNSRDSKWGFKSRKCPPQVEELKPFEDDILRMVENIDFGFDGAEVCELVGAFALSQLTKIFNKQEVGLYRDDGLAVFRDVSGHDADKIRKDITRVFQKPSISNKPPAHRHL